MTGKPIGRYLLEAGACDQVAMEQALELQLSYRNEGEYRPLGSIILEIKAVLPEALEQSLQQQRIDILSSADLFRTLSSEDIAHIATVAEKRILPREKLIFSEGDPGDTFCLVVSGGVRVFRTSEDGVRSTLTTLGPGSGFGEMALLTGEPRSASVETSEPTSLVVVGKDDFDNILDQHPELNRSFMKVLSWHLTRGNIQQAEATANQQAYQHLISEQSVRQIHALIGEGRRITRLRRQIAEVAVKACPVIFAGEPGTEKRDCAKLLHDRWGAAGRPFLVIDAHAVTVAGAEKESAGQLQLELAQESTLFGHEKGAFSFAGFRRLGLLEVANGGTVVIEHLDQLAPEMQEKLADFLQSGQFSRLGGRRKLQSEVLVLGTISLSATAAENGTQLNDRLQKQFDHTLQVPPLRERKRDLRTIVDHLLEHYSELLDKPVREVDREAYSQLAAYDWPGNRDELELVIRRGISLTAGETVQSQNLFLSHNPVTGGITFNLLRLNRVKQFVHSRWFPGLAQLLAGVFFLLVLLSGFLGSQSESSNIAVTLIWAVWWPLLVLSWLLLARFWCAVCPMGALNDLLSRHFSLRRDVPRFIRTHGLLLSAIGLGVIFWIEVSTGMPHSPLSTAWLILVITLLAVLSGLLFQRRVWCRYLCPVGRFSGVMSSCAALELRANPELCANDCRNYMCYVGEPPVSGCPVYSGPFAMNSNHDCIICGNCLKICPHLAPRLNLRLPGHELWSFLRPDKAILVLTPVILASQFLRGRGDHAGSGSWLQQLPAWLGTLSAMVLLTALVFLFIHAAARLAIRGGMKSDVTGSNLLTYALVPLVFAAEIGYRLQDFFREAGQLLPVAGRQLGLVGEQPGLQIGISEVQFLHILLILLGLLPALLLQWKLSSRFIDGNRPAQLLRAVPLLLVVFLLIRFNV